MAKEKDSNWMQNLWRPAMGWMYMLICLLDMAVFPVLWSLLQAFQQQQITQWNPLTLQGAGLFHIAMGAVLGIAAFGRTQEKLAGTAANPTSTTGGMTNGGFGVPSSGAPTFGAAPATGFGSSSGAFGGPAAGGFGGGGFGSVPSSPTSGGFGGSSGFGAPAGPSLTATGKKIVPPAEQPLI